MTTNQPSTAGYGLAPPSEAEVIADLVKLVGTDVAIVALREAFESGGDAGPRGNQQDALLHIAERLAARPDVAGVFGRSLAVRVRTYTAVSKCKEVSLTTPSGGAPPDAPPLDDSARLQEIADLRLHDVDIDAILSDITAEAARHFGLPVALVSVVLDQAQYFRGSHGLDGWMATTLGTPTEWSFCQHVVRNQEPFVVEDARLHPLMKDSPLVRMEGVRCYAGVPLVTFRGHVIGSFCVQGPDTRSFTKYDLAQLHRYAKEVITRIEQRRRGCVQASARHARRCSSASDRPCT